MVRRLKVPQGFAAVLPQGPRNQQDDQDKGPGERCGSDFDGLVAKMEEELCAIEGRDGKQARASCGRTKGVAYCWKNAMGERRPSTAEPRLCLELGECLLGG